MLIDNMAFAIFRERVIPSCRSGVFFPVWYYVRDVWKWIFNQIRRISKLVYHSQSFLLLEISIKKCIQLFNHTIHSRVSEIPILAVI